MAELTGVLADKGGLHAQRLVLDSVQVDGAALGGRLDERVHGHRQLESLGEDQARFARCPLAVPPVPQQARQALWPQHSTYATCQPFHAVQAIKAILCPDGACSRAAGLGHGS